MPTKLPNPLTLCRVCGCDFDDYPWDISGKHPLCIICYCCESEAGLDDMTPEIARVNRAKWLASGAPWRYPKHRPADWSLEAQLENLRYVTDDLWNIE